MAMCCGFTSCGSDDDVAYNHVQTPEKEAHGIYTGMFTRLQANSATAVPEEGEGTLVISATDTAYVSKVVFTCPSLSISATTVVNITYANDGFVFSNHSTGNPLGATIMGSITEAGGVVSDFQLKIRQGRSTKTFNINFAGVKSGAEPTTE